MKNLHIGWGIEMKNLYIGWGIDMKKKVENMKKILTGFP